VTDGQLAPNSEILEREFSAIGGEIQALAVEVQRVRSDFEHARDEENRKPPELELLNSRLETAREAVSRNTLNILDLETRLAELESERNRARDEGRGLENSLSVAGDRMEATDNHVRELETRFAELESERNRARDEVRGLENSLSVAGDRMEATDNHVRELEDRLKSKPQDYLNTFQDMLTRFRKQDLRINWTMSFTGIALLLGAVSVVILVSDVQRNATLLSSMSKDLKDLRGSIEGHLSLQSKPHDEKQQLTLPETPHSAPRTKAAAQPEKPKNPKKAIIRIDNSYPPSILLKELNQ